MSSASSERGGRRERVRSIARSISLSFWIRRFLGWFVFDLVLVVLALFLFCYYSCQSVAAFDLLDLGRSFSHIWFAGNGMSVTTWCLKATETGGATHTFYLLPAAEGIWPIPAFIVCWEVLDLLHYFSDTRRVRRKLQPLNELAVMADTLGQAGVADPMATQGFDADKMATLEQAIERATVDSPTVTTGDQDLRSIEVALNNLLRQMQEAKLQQMRFVNDASHELRTPIAVIQGYVNMLDRWGKTDETVLDESIEALKLESEHMQELVEQLLFLARGDSGRNTLQRQQMNLAQVVRDVWDESCMIDEGHIYQCDVPESAEESPRFDLVGDLAMIKQSMRIIIQNAAKYSDEGSRIRLSADADAESVSYVVQDEGIGMSERDASHIFERFYRADGARNGGTEGSGLGLSIAKWIVDAHGGTIEVLSREGVGTRFTVRLPRA